MILLADAPGVIPLSIPIGSDPISLVYAISARTSFIPSHTAGVYYLQLLVGVVTKSAFRIHVINQSMGYSLGCKYLLCIPALSPSTI